MGVIETWSARSTATTLLSTELNSLASGTFSLLGPAIDNTQGPIYAHLELRVTFAVAPSGNLLLPVYLVPALDGTNFGWGGASAGGEPPLELLVGLFQVRSVTTQHHIPLRAPVLLPNGKFAAVLGNLSNQALASSNNLVRMWTFRREVL